MPFFVDSRVAQKVDQLELDWNRYGVDPYGISKRELKRFYSLLNWLYENYFKVTVTGIDHVPDRGRAMLIGNHSGGIALDAAMVVASLLMSKEPPRLAQGMADKFINRLPFASLYSQKLGHFTGLPEHAERLLHDGRCLMVFPEGHRGTAKLYGDRNSLVRFGTGFMRLALKTKSPIVPFAFIGGGEAIPTIMNLDKIGKLFGLPYLPVTPYLLPLPRPVELELYYSEPMFFEGTGNEEDKVIFSYVEQVKERIGELIERGVRIRKGRGEAQFK